MDERFFIFRNPELNHLSQNYNEQCRNNNTDHYSPRRRLKIKLDKKRRKNSDFFNGKRYSEVKKTKCTSVNRTISKKNSKLDLKTMVTLFLKRSSVYALNQVGNSTTPKRKVFWMFILIFGAIGCAGQVSQFLVEYYKYPVVTNINSIREKYQEFPAVTVCNANSIRKEYMHCLKKKLNYDECLYGKTDNQTAVPENTSEPLCEEAANWNTNQFPENIIFQSQMIAQDPYSRSAYGHQIGNFIRGCTFDSDPCDPDDFKPFFSLTYGNCYTFNYVQEINNIFIVRAGPDVGLELELDVEVDKYNLFTDEVGARVQIHDPYLEHNIETEGVNISPGFKTYIGLSKYASERLPSPYKDHCRYYAVNDSQNLCYDLCSKSAIFSACSCIISNKYYSGIRPCDISKPSFACCFLKLASAASNITCDCPLPCHEAFYQYEISHSVWPSFSYYDDNKHMFIHDSRIRYLTLDEVRRTRLKLTVFFETLDFTVNNQKPMFQSSEVFSQVGGQMGLWLGLSLVAIFECVENLITLCKYRMRG